MFKLNVPFLRQGKGYTPAEGGCIMQVIDWIHRESWTDVPPCVHPVLRGFAIEVNDAASDTQRQQLLDLAPRLMGTSGLSKEQDATLLAFISRTFFQEENDEGGLDDFYGREDVWDGREDVWEDLGVDLSYRTGPTHDDRFRGLVTLLDEFDRLLGRNSVEPIDFSPACKVMATA